MHARRLAVVLAALLLGGCGWVRWGPQRVSEDEVRLDAEIRDYYASVQRAFAAGNPQALSSLFDASIVQPMTKAQVEAWAEEFFAKNGRAGFKILSFSLEDLGRERAVVLLRYAVRTPGGRGDFAGSERDT